MLSVPDSLLTFVANFWPWLLVAVVLGRLAQMRYHKGLNRFDGPFLASLTNLWRAWSLCGTKNRMPIAELHKRYGTVVRIGPNVLSFNDPSAIKDIYNKAFVKSEFYSVAAGVNKGVAVQTLFSQTDEVYHDKLRRSLANSYSMSHVVQYEPFVDKTVEAFLEQVGRRFADKTGSDGIVDLPQWMRAYAFDVIGELTYGERHGFLDSGGDVHGIVSSLRKAVAYGQLIGSVPFLDYLFWRNPVLLWLSKRGWYDATSPTVPFALRHLGGRLKAVDGHKELSEKPQARREDLLDKFLKAKRDNPDLINDRTVLGLSLSMVNAGSDTTAITLSALFYHLLKYPHCMRQLVEEIDGKLSSKHLPSAASSSKSVIGWREAQQLPYLEACIKETFRIHPSLSLFLERKVPASGAMVAGHKVPGGIIVGCNAWALHRNKSVWGDDVDVYRPERWLECDEEVAALRNRTLFQFGAGSHTCLGKNISLLEMYKLVPSFLRTFEITLEDPQKTWTIWNIGFIEVANFNVRIRRRSGR
ncbi:MAG: hypothetical protein Q9222_005615 [Ikaeria aurantiellina]